MKMKFFFLFLGVLLGFISLFAAPKYFFYIQLANKNNTPYSISNPSAYLSARALERRSHFNISVDSTDLPINSTYIAQLANLNIPVFSRSKWFNGITVLVSDSSIMSQVRALPFVRRVTYTGQSNSSSQGAPRKVKTMPEVYNYGSAAQQLNQLNASFLHNLGYTGKDVHVAVLDAGFLNANTNVGFDSLRAQGRLLGTKDFTDKTTNIYDSDAHGANVLSILTGNLPGKYLGAAPHASYWLIRTEYAPTEYLCETDFWVAGIEFADSVGADVVNSSLGYTTFDDPTLNFSYADMNGTVSRASKAATLASKKGILVCNSAGNDGNKAWKYIGVPADAPGIVTVGAVTSAGDASVFSSFGPSYDKRLKPDVCATGTSTAYINTSGLVSFGNGTSYSTPIMAGMFACLVQYAKTNVSAYTVSSLIDAVNRSANLYPFPTAQQGYGIPDFKVSTSFFNTSLKNTESTNLGVKVNTIANEIIISFKNSEPHELNFYTLSGQLVYSKVCNQSPYVLSKAVFNTGFFLLKIKNSFGEQLVKVQLANF